MQIKPTRDIILVEADDVKTKTDSGILIQETWKTIPPMGTIKAIGPEVTVVKPGDRVLFERYASVRYEDNLRFCRPEHIIAILQETEIDKNSNDNGSTGPPTTKVDD